MLSSTPFLSGCPVPRAVGVLVLTPQPAAVNGSVSPPPPGVAPVSGALFLQTVKCGGRARRRRRTRGPDFPL